MLSAKEEHRLLHRVDTLERQVETLYQWVARLRTDIDWLERQTPGGIARHLAAKDGEVGLHPHPREDQEGDHSP